MLVEQALSGGLAVVLLRALTTHRAGLELAAAELEALDRRHARQRERSALLIESLEGVAGTFTRARDKTR